jgi:fructose-1,6-bisphosphatase II
LWPRSDEERAALLEEGYDLDKILTLDDLISSDNCFFAATGISTGDLLRGVKFSAASISTQSLVMRSRSGTVRLIEAIHQHDKVDSLGV